MSEELPSLSEAEELFLLYLETNSTIKGAAADAGLSSDTGYAYARKLKDVILTRARDNLAVGTLKATRVMLDSMDADASTEKGELRLKAAESIMDRSGITKHTSVEVQLENENGIFILPAKVVVPAPEPQEDTEEERTSYPR
jgi:hypothetical protein